MREPHKPGLKVATTLRYLASGESYHSLSYAFRVLHNTISGMVKEVCQAIVCEYEEEVFQSLLGLVDADYKFLWADVGANGSTSDCAVFNASPLRVALEDGDIGFPDPEPLPNDDRDMPYFFMGDDAFPLRSWMMKPFAKRNLEMDERIFNYRLSRARRISENAFGMLASHFRCLLTTMQQDVETVKDITMACFCLHNLMRIRFPGLQNQDLDWEGNDHGVIPGQWRDNAVMQEVNNIRVAMLLPERPNRSERT